MWLEDYNLPESSEGWAKSAEVSEKFREEAKKASAGIQRTAKDEKKAKKHDILLANFLVVLILDRKYDHILMNLFWFLNKWYPSNFLIWIVSLVSIDISNKIREISLKPKIEFSYKSPNKVEFDTSMLHPQVQDRINYWLEDMVDIISIDYSNILTNRLLSLLKTDDEILDFVSNVFTFFLWEINLTIDEADSRDFTSYILSEVYKNLDDLKIEEV